MTRRFGRTAFLASLALLALAALLLAPGKAAAGRPGRGSFSGAAFLGSDCSGFWRIGGTGSGHAIGLGSLQGSSFDIYRFATGDLAAIPATGKTFALPLSGDYDGCLIGASGPADSVFSIFAVTRAGGALSLRVTTGTMTITPVAGADGNWEFVAEGQATGLGYGPGLEGATGAFTWRIAGTFGAVDIYNTTDKHGPLGNATGEFSVSFDGTLD